MGKLTDRIALPLLPTGTDNAVVKYNGTSAIQESGVIVDGSDNVSGVGTFTATGLVKGSSIQGTLYTSGRIPKFSTDGLVADSGVSIDASDNISGVGTLDCGAITSTSTGTFTNTITDVVKVKTGSGSLAIQNSSGTSLASFDDSGSCRIGLLSGASALNMNVRTGEIQLQSTLNDVDPSIRFITDNAANKARIQSNRNRVSGSGSSSCGLDFYASTSGSEVLAGSYTFAGAWTLGASSSARHFIQATNVAGQEILWLTKLGVAGGTTSSYFQGFFHGATAEGYIWHDGSGNMTFANASDERLKENFRDFNALELVDAVSPKLYDWKDGKGTDVIGFIAQDLQQTFPKNVNYLPKSNPEDENEEQYLGISESQLTAVLWKAVKELKAENNNLIARIEALENK